MSLTSRRYQNDPVVIGGDVVVATRSSVVDRYRIGDGRGPGGRRSRWRAEEYEPGAINTLSIGNGLLVAQTQRQITACG